MVKADAKLVPSLCCWNSPSRRQPGWGDREGADVGLVQPGGAAPRCPAAAPPIGLVWPGGKVSHLSHHFTASQSSGYILLEDGSLAEM